jgi:hypothetical protein
MGHNSTKYIKENGMKKRLPHINWTDMSKLFNKKYDYIQEFTTCLT